MTTDLETTTQLNEQVTALEQADQQNLWDATKRIQKAIRTSAEFIIQIGGDLLTIKEILPHGLFELFIEDNFEFSSTSAKRFMQVHERFNKTPILGDLVSPSSLYTLVGPNVPGSVVNRAIETIEAGEQVKLVDIKAWIEEINATKKLGAVPQDKTELHKIYGLALKILDNPNLYIETEHDKIRETIGTLSKLLVMLNGLRRAKIK